jgi:hypothetical protein
MKTHEWLPNQQLHFGSVRCIECHAVIQKDILVAHQIKPKEKAVKTVWNAILKIHSCLNLFTLRNEGKSKQIRIFQCKNAYRVLFNWCQPKLFS